MGMRFLSPDEALRALELSSKPYRPKAVIELREQIAAETRAANLNASVTGFIDPERVEKIVQMKLQLDALYCDWVQGRIS